MDHDILRRAYLGRHAQTLILKSSAQVADVYADRGITIPVATSSTLQYLFEHPGSSLSDLARHFEWPHQLAAQRTDKLIALALIEKHRDPNDRRRSIFVVTEAGQDQAERLVQCMADTAQVYTELFDEIGVDLADALLRAVDALERKTLSERFKQSFPERKAG
ncbi:MAG: MarR family winged helix-turn-helix transcriptional regulator [Pseudomonadota bacterium]